MISSLHIFSHQTLHKKISFPMQATSLVNDAPSERAQILWASAIKLGSKLMFESTETF